MTSILLLSNHIILHSPPLMHWFYSKVNNRYSMQCLEPRNRLYFIIFVLRVLFDPLSQICCSMLRFLEVINCAFDFDSIYSYSHHRIRFIFYKWSLKCSYHFSNFLLHYHHLIMLELKFCSFSVYGPHPFSTR